MKKAMSNLHIRSFWDNFEYRWCSLLGGVESKQRVELFLDPSYKYSVVFDGQICQMKEK
jgi:hypothetical protein